MKTSLLLLAALFWFESASAALQVGAIADRTVAKKTAEDKTTPPAAVEATRLSTAIAVDGILDEAIWAQAVPITHFRQRDPNEGAAPSQRTEVRIFYDDDALYVGARMYDTAPDSIVARLGRRDAELDADRFGFFIDPYDDNRSGYYFGVNAAGTLYDGVLMNDDWDDETWDGVWQARVQIDDEGWTAELRVPYSQLRFYEREQYTWGINFRRDIARHNEQIYLVYTPRNESGFVSRFVDLVGMERIRPARQVEVVPYVTARARFNERTPGNPFNDGSRYTRGVGADVKVGLTSNLTLNATVNPDFGQVEVDPAVVNLSDVESFFQEKRPFFIEGANIFNFGSGGATSQWGFNWGNPQFFYSRRVGRAPQGSTPSADFVDRPEGTRILGATKLTGRVGDGWSVGMVHAVTAREWADLQQGANQLRSEVEPAAYYGIARAQREFDGGRRALGFMTTATARSFEDDRLRDQINSEAYTFGVDGWTFLDPQKTWVVTGWAGLTNVHGTEKRITSLQRSSLHYYQRPDAGHVSVDSSATSLSGYAGRFMLNKERGNLYLNTALGFISPGFNPNDLGFMWRTDVINGHVAGGYRWSKPTPYYRSASVNASLFRSADFDGNTLWTGVWTRAHVQFLNYYMLNVGMAANPETVNNRRTRGGPLTINPPGFESFLFARSDSRKPWVFGVNGFTYQTRAGDNYNLGAEVEWRPAANVSLTWNPEVSWNHSEAQWVGSYADPLATATFGRRYVFADIDQMTVSSSLRLNWTFSPQLSFQLYAQPLLSAGDYSEFKELKRARSFDFLTYGEEGSTFDAATITADPDGAGPAAPLALYNPDFNFKSLRGTAVMRWEYRPGSTLYLVWTQRRSDSERIGNFGFSSAVDRLVDAHPDNIFMVKFNYWLSR